MKQWEWKLCDHKWNNLKRWVDAFTEGKDDADMMRVLSLKEMVNAIDIMQKTTDDVILAEVEASFKKEK
jgi:hypothetical protein